MTTVLGIDVPDQLLDAWAGWLAPHVQPFVTDDVVEGGDGVLTPELVDTYRLWGIGRTGARIAWLSEDDFHALPRAARGRLVREQVAPRRGAVPTVRAWQDVIDPRRLRDEADGHRFVWWRSLVDIDPTRILTRAVSHRRLPSRHAAVATSTWRACEPVLPFARALAGTFPNGTTTHCFGTVMSAAGAAEPETLESTEPFERWLADRCRPGGDDGRPGTVLVWRVNGDPVHAAVTIGDGWALEKPSRDWHAPRAVATVTDVVRAARQPGQRVERHTIYT